MRPSEHVPLPEAGESEHGRPEGQERAHSPAPSIAGSYGLEGDEYYDSEDERPGRESDRGSTTAHEPIRRTGSPSAPQQKPKRTRQLTTPHQSAVLHALLAQSRFPTTQMREEVGRQIGLSARKVQVWFQNQRQKARKESKEAALAAAGGGTASRGTGPPQFGAYSNAPSGSSAITGAALGEDSSSGRSRPRQGRVGELAASVGHDHPPGSGFAIIAPASQHTSTPLRRASEPSLDIYSGSAIRRSSRGDLTGPGVPGTGAAPESFPQPPSTLSAIPSSQYPRPMSPERPPRLPPVHSITPSISPGARYEGQAPGPSSYQREHFEQGSASQSLRLPPIQIRTTDRQEGPVTRAYAGHTGHPPSVALSQPRGGIVIPAPTTRRGEPSFRPLTPSHIPPPFTLEPTPVWQLPTTISERSRTRSGPVSHSTPSAGSSRQVPQGSETFLESRTLPPPTRTMRFDPVRNTEIYPQQPNRMGSRSPNEEE